VILSAQTIRELCTPEAALWAKSLIDSNPPLINPFKEPHLIHGLSRGLSPCGYDISIDQDLTIYPVSLRYLTLSAIGFHRPSFCLASSYERFDLPHDICFRIMDKSTWIRRGLTVHNTVAEPGWRGYITLELCNQGTEVIELQKGMPIAQVVFERLDAPTIMPYAGKYQDQRHGPQPALYENP
jgi:dCTP deaminase